MIGIGEIDNNNFVRIKLAAKILYAGSVVLAGSIATIYEYETISRLTDFSLEDSLPGTFSDMEVSGIERFAKFELPLVMFMGTWFFIMKGAYSAYDSFDKCLNYCLGFPGDISQISTRMGGETAAPEIDVV